MTTKATTDADATADATKYRDELIVALRWRDVPAERIGEILAEVDSHVAETGEDPREQFGSPRQYAKRFPSRDAERGRTRPWAAGQTSWGLAGGLVGAELSLSVTALVLGRDRIFGVAPVVDLAVGAVVGIVGLVALARRAGTIRDPRTGRPVGPSPALMPPVMVLGFAVLLGLVALVTALAA